MVVDKPPDVSPGASFYLRTVRSRGGAGRATGADTAQRLTSAAMR
jgi:hypothetical protein